MKSCLLIAAVLGLAAAGWQLSRPDESPPAPVVVQAAGPAPDTTEMDSATVFQKAFWKRPSEEDRIHNAERREWMDNDSVSRWQWFLEVQPSAEIVRYLRDENAFRLSPAEAAVIPPDAPSWFIKDTEDARILSSSGDGMQLIFTPGDSRLYAMGGGGGFQVGAPESSPAMVRNPAAGRLPLESPPTRENP